MTSVKDVDRGLNYVVRKAAELSKKTHFSVGVPADAGEYPDGTPVARVAAAHEFGEGVPQRSFIRGWFDEKGTGWFGRKMAQMAQDSVLKGISMDAQVAEFGAQAVKEIQARMDNGIAPALKEETVKRKQASGSSTPELEDTHRLRNAIRWSRDV